MRGGGGVDAEVTDLDPPCSLHLPTQSLFQGIWVLEREKYDQQKVVSMWRARIKVLIRKRCVWRFVRGSGQHRDPPMSTGVTVVHRVVNASPARAAHFRTFVFICKMGIKTAPTLQSCENYIMNTCTASSINTNEIIIRA